MFSGDTAAAFADVFGILDKPHVFFGFVTMKAVGRQLAQMMFMFGM